METVRKTFSKLLRGINRLPGRLAYAFRKAPLILIIGILIITAFVVSLIVHFAGGAGPDVPPEDTGSVTEATSGTGTEPGGVGTGESQPPETTADSTTAADTSSGSLAAGQLKTLKTEEKRGNTVILTVDIMYYEFPNPAGSEPIAAINAAVLAAAQEFYDAAVTVLLSFAEDEYKSSSPVLPYYFNATCAIRASTKEVLSISFVYERFAGENDVYSGERAYNYDVGTGKQLTPADVFSVSEDEYAKKIYGYVAEKIKGDLSNYHESVSHNNYDLLRSWELENRRWYFSEEGFVLFYNPYEIAPGNMGIRKFTVPYSELEGILKIKPDFSTSQEPGGTVPDVN